jgi:magnesium chelatase subunit D
MNGYPFSALVGQERLKTALLICAVNSAIGGVVVRGDKGTAKSTAARALAEILSPIQRKVGCAFNCLPEQPISACETCHQNFEIETVKIPFIDLPIGATEDRLLGSLDFERALKEGRRAFQPGLLASANRGILYIDEENLLPDHLVDVLLDVAAMGVNTIQREGLSISHPSRIALIGTMNLEEGDLRPQMLDRFAMLVEVKAPMEASTRAEVVRRRIEFELNSEDFAKKWHHDQEALRKSVLRAQELLPLVRLDDALLNFISQLCCEFNVTSLRADIVMHKAARTLAAIDGRTAVLASDIRTAAELVLPHRMRKRPGDSSGLDQERLDDLIKQAPAPEQSSAQRSPSFDLDPAISDPDPSSSSSSAHEESKHQGTESGAPMEQIFAPAAAPASVARIEVKVRNELDSSVSGRRSSVPASYSGHFIRAAHSATPRSIAIDATIRHSVLRNNGKLKVSREDLHEKVRVGKTGNLILFVVDASGSMAALKRMEAVKGAIIALLDDIYQKRDKVGLISFRGEFAELVFPLTRSVEIAANKMHELKTGGRTPLSHALDLAVRYLEQTCGQDAAQPLLVVLTDGKANVAQVSDADPWSEALEYARAIGGKSFPALVLDTESGYIRFGKAKQLAESMAASYLPLDDLSAEGLIVLIRSHLSERIKR